MGYDPDIVLSQLDRAMWRNAGLMVLVLLLAIAGAWFAGERLVRRPVKRLVKAARRQEAGDREVRFPALAPNTELGQLSRALNRMSEANAALLSQREILMRELQHRVMNSLQLLASFLQLQSRNADPATREQLAVARERIVSMSTIFRYLYRADLGSSVEFGAFLQSFCTDTGRAYLGGTAPKLQVEADTLEIPLEQALSLALMTHELITNAIKHGFRPAPPARSASRSRSKTMAPHPHRRGRRQGHAGHLRPGEIEIPGHDPGSPLDPIDARQYPHRAGAARHPDRHLDPAPARPAEARPAANSGRGRVAPRSIRHATRTALVRA